MRILIVEDDELVADALKRGLAAAGFAVDRVASAEQAEAALATEEFDLAVVDIGLPKADGLTLVRRLRRGGSGLPVLILTARDGLADRVDALDLGADDYLTKPFELPEVAARCRALIRRTRSATSAELRIGALTLDLKSRTAELGGQLLDVTRREWSILECLALDAGPRGPQGEAAARDRRLGRGADAERGRGLRVAAARQTRRRRRDPHRARPRIPAG